MLNTFAEYNRAEDAHLLLAGPSVAGVSDDPEGAEVQVEGETRGVVFEACAVGEGAAGAAPPTGVAVGPRAEAPRFIP